MRRMAALAAAVVCAAALAGCSSGGQASETLPTTSTASGSAEPSETLRPLGPPDLPMPAEAREQTPAGAEAFLRYYMDVYNLAQRTLDSQYMREFSRDCATCDQLADDIDADQALRYTYEGGALTVNGVSPPVLSGSQAETAFSITQAPLTVLGSDGSPVPELTFPERNSPGCGAIMAWSNETSSWVISQWDVN